MQSTEVRPGPLAGRRIVVTRSLAQARDFGDRLTSLGAHVIYCPAIRIAEPADPGPFRAAAAAIDTFDWLILTSRNGVRAFFDEMGTNPLPTHLQVACVGPATAAALREHGVEPAAMPDEFVGSEIATALAGRISQGARVLLARGAGGSRELLDRLRVLGAEVADVESYRSIPDLENLGALQRELDARAVDLITFTSPSTVSNLLEGLGARPRGVAFAAIGPVTAARMEELGLEAAVVAPEHSVPGLTTAIVDYFASVKGKENAHE